MNFQLRCPKCKSTTVNLSRDAANRFGPYLREGVPLLHCRTCGKQVYGVAAEEEVARQHAIWAAEQAERAAKEAAERAACEPVPLPPGKCGWRGCNEPHGDWSKYCSVDCRHKAARYTYDLKKGRVKQSGAEASAK